MDAMKKFIKSRSNRVAAILRLERFCHPLPASNSPVEPPPKIVIYADPSESHTAPSAHYQEGSVPSPWNSAASGHNASLHASSPAWSVGSMNLESASEIESPPPPSPLFPGA